MSRTCRHIPEAAHVRRPRLRRSSVTVSRATFCTRLRDNGVTIGPIRNRAVFAAIALRTIQGSATARTGGGKTMWSHRNKPSHPRDSARTAKSASSDGSESSSKGAKNRPRRALVEP